MKILYVEDDEHIQWLTSTILTSLNHEVSPASDAAQAWRMLEQNPKHFDCLILDKNMPQCSGLELLRAIRSSAWHYDIPAIMLTAEAGNNCLIECLEGGVNLYLTKPATQELLKAALEQVQAEMEKRLGLLNQSKQFSNALSCMSHAHFRIQTPSQASSLAWLLSQQAQQTDHTYLGILEILINAIEHGNLHLKPSERKSLLSKDDFRQELELLSKQSPFCTKWVEVDFSSDDCFATIEVTDQGFGFDWQSSLNQNHSAKSWANVRGFHKIKNAGFINLHYRNNGRTAVLRMKKADTGHETAVENHTDSMAILDPLESAISLAPQDTTTRNNSAEALDLPSQQAAMMSPYDSMSRDFCDFSNSELLKAINKITSGFIASNDFGKFFELTLDVILSVTESEYGFLSELMYDANQQPFMRAYAISNIAWDQHSLDRYQSFIDDGHMDFHAMDNLFGSVLLSGEPLIANTPKHDARSGGFPKGHRNMDAFLGILLIGSGKVLGMVAIANRPGGYHKDMIDWLEPVRSILSSIIISMRNERHRLMIEKQLLEAKEIAERANDAKSFFLATISHEIRTPMNAIVGMSDLLMESPLTSTQTYFAKVINRNTELLLSIINDVLNLSKLKAGKMKVIEADFDLESVLSEVAEILGHSAHEKNLALIFNYPRQLPRKLYGDASKIKQILINLVSNAIKFTDQGHVLVTVNDSGKNVLCIEVQDTGIGIPDNAIPQLFSLFHQVDQTASREYGGTGLGLAISQEFAKLLGGQIRIQSTEGIGSTFGFEFPLNAVPQADDTDCPVIQDVEIHLISTSSTVCRLAQAHFKQYADVDIHAYCSDVEPFNLEQCRFSGRATALVMIEQDHPLLTFKTNKQQRIQSGFFVYTAQEIVKSADGKLALKQENNLGMVSKHFGFTSFEQELGTIIAKLNGRETGQESEQNPQNKKTGSTSPVQDILFADRAPPSILLVEDNPINQDVASLVLTQMGCLVDIAFNGIQALEKYARHTYDLILMDCQMPVMDGLTATAKIRDMEMVKNAERTPIVAITANALPSDRTTCINAGMDDYLAKPFKRSQVKEILKKFLAPKNHAQEKASSDYQSPPENKDQIFDAELMMEVTNNDWKLVNKIVSKYRSSLPGQVRELAELIAKGETSILCTELHRMRGSALGTGFSLFSGFLKEIETDLHAGRKLDTDKAIQQLDTHFKAIMAFSASERNNSA